MLRVIADIFSGRSNPVWTVTDEKEVQAVLKEVARNREILTDSASAMAGLGFRGIMVEPLTDDMATDFGVPSSMYIALDASSVGARGAEIAERLIGLIPKAVEPAVTDAEAMALDESLQSFLLEQLVLSTRTSALDGVATPPTPHDAAAEAAGAMCYYDTSPYNPGFWNNDPYVRSRNNCYNYASNRRTDTYAQPGKGCGHMYTAITCAEITRAALCDGKHRRYDCFPNSEYPRYLIALAVIPNGGDYHWYRLMREGFWAHKPGGTAVRNVDNSGQVITNPATCNRGPYTQFCGYFYTCKSQKVA
jgi:hypothetical protein